MRPLGWNECVLHAMKRTFEGLGVGCYALHICVSPDSYVEALTSSVMVLGLWPLGGM